MNWPMYLMFSLGGSIGHIGFHMAVGNGFYHGLAVAIIYSLLMLIPFAFRWL